jgi:hypothetical protein
VAWLVLAGAFAQLAVFASVHTSPRGLIWIDLAVAVSLLVGHEIATRGTAARALRAAITH